MVKQHAQQHGKRMLRKPSYNLAVGILSLKRTQLRIATCIITEYVFIKSRYTLWESSERNPYVDYKKDKTASEP